MRAAKWTIISCMSAFMAGCSQTPYPHFIEGNYYMGGDAKCVRFQRASPTRIICADKSDKVTGYRDAMTNQQLAMYQQYQNQQRLADQQALANLSAQNAAAASIQYPTMAAPRVAPIQQPGGNVVSCIRNGIQTVCRY